MAASPAASPRRPLPPAAPPARATASSGPETTQARAVDRGQRQLVAQAAARPRRPEPDRRASRRAACSCISRPRAATTAAAHLRGRRRRPGRRRRTRRRCGRSSPAGATPQRIHSRASGVLEHEQRRLRQPGLRQVARPRRRAAAERRRAGRGRGAARRSRHSDRRPRGTPASASYSSAPHPGYCDALAGEQERDRRRVARCSPGRDARADRGRRGPRTASAASRADHARRCANARRPAWSVKATSSQVELGMVPPSARRGSSVAGVEGGGRAGRQHQQLARPRTGAGGCGRRLLEDDVGVGAADAEGADAGAPRRRPGAASGVSAC